MVDIALMGHGTVGSGVSEILLTHKQKLFASLGEELNIKYILDLRDFPDHPLADRFIKDFDIIKNDRDIRIVVEVMGGLHPAYDFVKELLSLGKSVVTSNKELVAAYGAELLKIAKENNANFFFEASVGGGIPIIRPISQCLVANNVSEIAGILNGTTNFILTKMITEGMDFNDALKLAQDLGYAERNPEADVEGHDACRKICILASLAFSKHIYPDNVRCEGITKIALEDVEYARVWGGVVKLIGKVKKLQNGLVDILVAPMFIPNSSQLSSIDDVFNGIMVRGDCTGDVVFYGKGAGKLPTASAVVADIVDATKHLKTRKYLYWADGDNSNVLPYKESITQMYIRCHADDTDKAKDVIREVFNDVDYLKRENADDNELAFVTDYFKFGEIEKSIEILKENKITVDSAIRIGDL